MIRFARRVARRAARVLRTPPASRPSNGGDAATMRQSISTRIGAHTYTLASDDRYLEHIASGGEAGMAAVYESVVRKEHVVLDVGANIGYTAILLGQLAKSVHAFEPSPTTYEFLRTNTANSGLRNIVLHPFALGDSDGEAVLATEQSNRSGGFISDTTRGEASYRQETIRIRTLDAVWTTLELGQVDFIKIDVEGFESRVLKGASHTIQTFRPVVVAEMNHWCLNAFQRIALPDYFDTLRSHFPILLAVDDVNAMYADLNNPDQTYLVLYEHILRNRYSNVVGAFEERQLSAFRSAFKSI